jgi:hypothetical protein
MPDFGAFDLYATRALGVHAILEVHTEGGATFAEIGENASAKVQPSSRIRDVITSKIAMPGTEILPLLAPYPPSAMPLRIS